jgi:murein endopeptidase
MALAGACVLGGLSRPSLAGEPPDPAVPEATTVLCEPPPAAEEVVAPEGSVALEEAVTLDDPILPIADELVPAPVDVPPADEAVVAVEGHESEPAPGEDVPEDIGLAEPEPAVHLDDRDALRHFVVSEPAALGPLSIGTPDGGLLFNPLPMPEGALWTVRDPRETFATAETIDFLVAALEQVEATHPGSPRLLIGDMSRPDGGRLNRHRSHQAGRDVDLGFYYRTGEAAAFRRPGRNELDLARTWTLVRTLVTDTDVERIFLDRAHQRPLYAYALAQGEAKEWLDDIFGRKTGGKDAIIQHERRHHDHMHVRFFNRGAQEKGRVAYPLLVEAGLVPGPTLTHRVRRGETLSHLARRYGTSASAIRAANHLRGSTLRAGRSYVIPVRKLPSVSDPVVVPPRRLPRELKAAEPEPPEARADGGEVEPR